MDLIDVVDGFRADAIVTEATHSCALGYLGGLCTFGPLAGGLWATAELLPSMLGLGIVLSVAIYIAHFGMFSNAKVTARFERRGVISAPEVTFARMDVLLRRLWLTAWFFGVAEEVLLMFLVPHA